MSSEIERFGRFGQYVLFSEYERVVASIAARAMEQIDSMNAVNEAEVARLRAELQNAAKAALDATALACEKEREADALRVNAERYLWLRDQSPWSYSKNPCPYSKQEDGELRCITAGLDEAIDAAMGEGK